jgi:HAD superfamily hydrolase (TIGR01509 family)
MTDLRSPAIILDVDGTLVDSNDAHARAWIDAFHEEGIEVPEATVRRAIGMGGDKLVPHVAGISEDSPIGQRVSERRAEIFRTRYLPHVRPFPRVRELLQRLTDDGFTIVVASSAKKDELRCLLDVAGVADLVKARTSSDDAEESKPDPDIVEAALRGSGAPPEAAIMLGDTPYDVTAAQRAGIRTVGVECGGWNRDDLRGAIAVYRSPADLLQAYEESVFAELRKAASHDRRHRAARARWVPALFLIAGAVLAVAGLASRRVSRQREEERHRLARLDWSDRERRRPPPRLSRRDRDRLKRIIARTS